MDKIIFAVLAVSVTAFAALAPASAGPTRLDVDPGKMAIRSQDGLRADVAPPQCRVKRSWSYDYAGKPYLKKVRVCA
ncbi:MAG: hypothetical protein JWM58_659 [Rhizobium sp.]|nr:hypothetical protein [Rhizobium sp.]